VKGRQAEQQQQQQRKSKSEQAGKQRHGSSKSATLTGGDRSSKESRAKRQENRSAPRG